MKRKKRPGSSVNDDKTTANSDTTTESKTKFGRRGFLKVGAGAAAAALANPLESVAQRRTARLAGLTGECNGNEFSEPKPVPARMIDGKSILKWELNAEGFQWSYQCPGEPKQTGAQPVYNAAVPGPTLLVDPGTRISLTLNNKLGAMKPFTGDQCPGGHHTDPPTPSCFQHTNLHTHGLMVSPCSVSQSGSKHCGPYAINGTNPALKFSSDDVLVDIFPGQSNQYEIQIPDIHASGTHWYHSHLHGASAYQVSGGMAGALIIRDFPEDQMVREDLDKVFVLQEVLLNPDPPGVIPPVYGNIGAAPDTQVFVNGICRPTLTMLAGQTMRWRFINATGTPRGLMKLRLVKTPTCTKAFPTSTDDQVMHLMAMDGIRFYGFNPQPVRYHLMGPGSRADFLVNLTTPGIYTLVKDGFPLESVTKPSSTNYTRASAGSTEVLAFIEVVGSTYKDEIPKIITGMRPTYLKPITRVDRVRPQPVQFQNPAAGQFKIDNAYYDANVPITANLNTAEEWTLQNTTGVSQANTHPFHVHVNPFQVVNLPFDYEVSDADLSRFGYKRLDPNNPCNWPFLDTVPLPAQIPARTGPPGQLKIRTRFLIYDGEYVTHCHILVHEDVGMMINVKLIGDGVGPGVPVPDYPINTRTCIDRTSVGCL